MTTISAAMFNSHFFIKKLIMAGMPEPQAEILAEEQIHMLEALGDQTATKYDLKELEKATQRDLKELEKATQRDLKEVKLELKAQIASVKAELIRWVVTVAGLQVAFMAALKIF